MWTKSPSSESKLFAFEHDGKTGFIDDTGKVVIRPTMDQEVGYVGDFQGGLVRVPSRGYFDQAGHLMIEDRRDFGLDASDGLVPIGSGPMTYVDAQGEAVVNVSYLARGFHEGLAAFEEAARGGFVDAEGFIRSLSRPGKQGFVDRSGAIAIPAQFAEVGAFSEGRAKAVVDGVCYIAGPNGYRQGTPTAGAQRCGSSAPDYVSSACPVGFIDETGDFVIEPKFRMVRAFSEGLAAVQQGSLWGFVDRDGQFVVEPQFDEAQSLHEGLAAVKKGDLWGYINPGGQMVLPSKYRSASRFSDSLALINGSTYIDRQGAVVLEVDYVRASLFVHGLAAVQTGKRSFAYINKKGEKVFRYSTRTKLPKEIPLPN